MNLTNEKQLMQILVDIFFESGNDRVSQSRKMTESKFWRVYIQINLTKQKNC